MHFVEETNINVFANEINMNIPKCLFGNIDKDIKAVATNETDLLIYLLLGCFDSSEKQNDNR